MNGFQHALKDATATAAAFQAASRYAPDWTEAAIESLSAFQKRTGHKPDIALISEAAARHITEYAGDPSLLLGIPTRIADIDGIDWA